MNDDAFLLGLLAGVIRVAFISATVIWLAYIFRPVLMVAVGG